MDIDLDSVNNRRYSNKFLLQHLLKIGTVLENVRHVQIYTKNENRISRNSTNLSVRFLSLYIPILMLTPCFLKMKEQTTYTNEL